MVTVRTPYFSFLASERGPDVEAWLKALSTDRPAEEFEVIRRACLWAQQVHAGHTRDSGESYFEHALAVASILADLGIDHESITAAILHHVVDDPWVTLADVEHKFGRNLAALVEGAGQMEVIHDLPGAVHDQENEHGHAESLRKMLLAMAEDVRVVLITLADRLHNMRTLGNLAPDRQQHIARETMDIYAPLAHRLGIWQIKWELEDLAFRYLHPKAYKEIANSLAERRVDRERYIQGFVAKLKQELDRFGIKAEVTGRPKHIYGIWRKMQSKQQDFRHIYDTRAVRVLLDEIPQCYAALGVVHTLWQYLPGEFDDYITTPKANRYRSIHTAVLGPEGKVVEVQIRTHEMHGQAELGIAAHWHYKEGTQPNVSFARKIAWLRQLLDWKDEVSEASDLVDQFKADVFQDRVYVFTPKGNVVDLPQGATPLDFAYHIHTEIGHRCRGAKVNGHIVPLTYELKTGEQVAVLTLKKGEPSRDWLNPHSGYLKTRRARSKVRSWFRQQDYDRNVTDGRATLERELKRIGFPDLSYDKLAQQFEYKKVDDFVAAIGRGDIKPSKIINFVPHAERQASDEATPTVPVTGVARSPLSSTIQVQGVGDLLTRMAGCCKPVPGESIVGFITRGHGVTIHRRDCHKALTCVSECPERLVEVNWGHEEHETYPVDIQILAFDRRGLLRDIATLLANEKINVIASETASLKDTHTANMAMTLEIPNLDTLSRVMARISQLPNVLEVWRKSH
jgi:GTP pyrophosphokinase